MAVSPIVVQGICDLKMQEPYYTITIEPVRVAKILSIAVIGVVVLSVIGQSLKYSGWLVRGVDEFYVDAENNIPTYFASFLLLLSAFLLALVAAWKSRLRDRFCRHWAVLAGLLLLLSIDETASLHERLSRPIRALLDVDGWFYYAWVIPGFIFVLLFALSYLKFFFYLPKAFKGLFWGAGLLYIAGALGVELIGGQYADLYGRDNFTYSLIATVEETLEFSGSTLLIYALLQYLARHVPAVHLQVQEYDAVKVRDQVASPTFRAP